MLNAECGVSREHTGGMTVTKCGLKTPRSAFRTPHSVLRIQHSNGFTLFEVIITIVIVSILAGIAGILISQGVRAFSDEQARSDVYQQARLGMERMAREIRVIRSRTDITTMANTNLRFTDVAGTTVGFNWASPTLQRWNGIGNDVLASNITAFTFAYYQQDGVTAAAAPATLWLVEITLTATQGSETLQLRSRVHPRNF
ncbi:MAG TPA: hypothetical protein DCO77_11300 [Nitrospiraceae bacterium]|nr:hypothetical protein [Nitrospiraceae bacterium]